jgi:SRSO17 transposase
MLAELSRKTCWSIAEHAEDPSSDGMQHLLNRARWDTEGVAADLRGFIAQHLGEPDAVLIVDESGDLKKGEHTVGVQRQYTGTAGRIENAQVAVYLAYASRTGHALIDRELYLPRSWAADPDRRTAAGVPDEIEFATKPALATAMIARGVAAGLPAGWVTGDEVYGIDPDLRAQLETLRLGYVLASAATAVPPSMAPAVASGCALTRSPPGWVSTAGPGTRPEPARRGHASTTGHSSRCTPTTGPGTAGC